MVIRRKLVPAMAVCRLHPVEAGILSLAWLQSNVLLRYKLALPNSKYPSQPKHTPVMACCSCCSQGRDGTLKCWRTSEGARLVAKCASADPQRNECCASAAPPECHHARRLNCPLHAGTHTYALPQTVTASAAAPWIPSWNCTREMQAAPQSAKNQHLSQNQLVRLDHTARRQQLK